MAHRWSARASWLTGNSRRLSSTLGSAVAKEALFGSGTSGGDGDEEELNGDLHDELVVAVMMMIQTSNSGGGDADETVLEEQSSLHHVHSRRWFSEVEFFKKRERSESSNY